MAISTILFSFIVPSTFIGLHHVLFVLYGLSLYLSGLDFEELLIFHMAWFLFLLLQVLDQGWSDLHLLGLSYKRNKSFIISYVLLWSVCLVTTKETQEQEYRVFSEYWIISRNRNQTEEDPLIFPFKFFSLINGCNHTTHPVGQRMGNNKNCCFVNLNVSPTI